MRKVETRIKVVTKGDDVKYIPQVKGCNQSRVEWWFYFMPIFGQVFLLVSAWGFIKSFFWDNLSNYTTHWFVPSKADAEQAINEFYADEINLEKPIKHKKQVSYIKYP
jgi:hypothetical protein